MQLRKKVLWFNWFYLLLFYHYFQETSLERDTKKIIKYMRRLIVSVITFPIGLLFPLIKQLQGFPLNYLYPLISEITAGKFAKKVFQTEILISSRVEAGVEYSR